MNQWLSLIRREFGSYFSSFTAYMILLGYLFLGGLISWFCLMHYQRPTMRYYFDFSSFLLIFIAPTITMRSFAEERKQGTLEMLMTTRVLDIELVLAKYFGAFLFYLVLLLPSICYFWILQYYSEPDVGSIIAGYLGNLCLASLYLAFGVFYSSLTQSQIVAALWGVTTIFGLNIFSAFEENLISMYEDFVFYLQSFTESKSLDHALDYSLELMDGLIHAVSVQSHVRSFYQGIIDTRDLVYFVSIVFFLLFLTTKSIEKQRWGK